MSYFYQQLPAFVVSSRHTHLNSVTCKLKRCFVTAECACVLPALQKSRWKDDWQEAAEMWFLRYVAGYTVWDKGKATEWGHNWEWGSWTNKYTNGRNTGREFYRLCHRKKLPSNSFLSTGMKTKSMQDQEEDGFMFEDGLWYQAQPFQKIMMAMFNITFQIIPLFPKIIGFFALFP